MLFAPQLLPEWAKQEAIILAWPDEFTDWKPWLNEVRETYRQLINGITNNETGVILLIREAQVENVKAFLQNMKNVLLVSADYNDTWCRDYAFLTCKADEGNIPVEFTFNGWGNKFDAQKDNGINQSVLAKLCKNPLISIPLVAEGGALEINQDGYLLSTELCLTNPQRNGEMTLSSYADHFKKHLGATQFSALKHGHLQGDDTDGHIDTLVRYTPHNGLVIQSCFNRPNDDHYQGLSALVNEVKQCFPSASLFELPLPYIVNDVGERLPASYANYLVNNGQVLVPTYQQPEDQKALEIVQKAHPDYSVIGVDSLSLIQQFGSIHCISMQVPKGTLKTDVVAEFGPALTVHKNG